MAKAKKIVYFCQECGYESAKWQGQCPGCRAWNTLVEESVVPAKTGGGSVHGSGKSLRPVSIAEIETREEQRMTSGIRELDRVLGGGIVRGSLMLVGGDPGI
ncbi:MAG TPA: DNA repair protein RadA, partial [Lachnospiraceae bacterium]|nr:DNA repair protein RadA [Lachnospiraceae bacterium]